MRLFLTSLAALSLAGAAAQADIQPQSGIWQSRVSPLDLVGCPTQMLAMLPAIPEQTEGQRLDFPQPFDPNDIHADIVWERVAEDHWGARHNVASPTPMGDLNVDMTHDLRVLSPVEMAQHTRMVVTFPASLGAMLGMAGACDAQARITHRYVGP